MKQFSVAALAAAVLLLTACNASVSITADAKGGSTCTVVSSMGAAVEKTIRTISGADSSSPLFDAAEIKKGLSDAGFTETAVKLPSSSSLSLQTYAKNLAEGIHEVPGALAYSKAADGSQKLTLTLSPQTLQTAASLLPEKEHSYIDLLMAPVFTGEAMTEQEYIETVSSVYGDQIADELKSSTLTIIMTAAGSSGTAAKKTIRLIDLLTLTGNKSITSSLVW